MIDFWHKLFSFRIEAKGTDSYFLCTDRLDRLDYGRRLAEAAETTQNNDSLYSEENCDLASRAGFSLSR